MIRSSTRRQAKRSVSEWLLRGGLAVAAVVVGYGSTTQTLAFALHTTNPERAYVLSPGDGRIAGELAERIAASGTNSAQRVRATRLARQALIDDALAVPALTALALNVQLAGKTDAARRLFAHSDTLSRRELGTRLWLIEDAVASNDVADALRHYDIALRTAKSAPDLLYPVLSEAITDPEISRSLSITLAKRPAWGDAFVQYLGSSKTDPAVTAALFRRLATLGYPVPDTAQVGVVNALVAKGAFDDAWRYYVSFRTGQPRDRSRDPDFAAQLQAPSAFDWTPVTNDAGVNASMQRTREGGILDFSVPSTVGGMVLQQVQLLPAGRYRLEGISVGIEQAAASQPYWQLSCMDGRELGRVEMRNSTVNSGRFGGEFMIDGSNCPAQTLRLITRPSSDIGGITGQIDRALLIPFGTNR